MDSWKYLSEGRGMWFSEELDFTVDVNGGCKSKVVGCDIKPSFNGETYPLVSNTQALERLDFMELVFSDEIRKSYSMSSEPSGEVFSDEIGTTDSYGNVVSPFCDEKELGSKISTDFMHSNSQDVSLIGLKLGRLVDGGGAKDISTSKSSVPSPSSTASSLPAKRVRSTILYPRSPCCQVLGCNKDLSSCKGYYKRHKVCDVHTKTAKVVVDGIEQRFCQQCSRFHLLAEFDDGKRSCRRRLSAHNKRRRKPQLTSESDNRIIGFSPSFAFPEAFPSVGFSRDNLPASIKGSIVSTPTLFNQNSSGSQQTTRALSLLSSSSHSHYNPVINKSSHADYTSQGSGEADVKVDPTVDFNLPDDGMLMRGPGLRNHYATNYHHRHLQSLEMGRRGIVLDLLQLSSHLQRIEQQRHSTESEAAG